MKLKMTTALTILYFPLGISTSSKYEKVTFVYFWTYFLFCISASLGTFLVKKYEPDFWLEAVYAFCSALCLIFMAFDGQSKKQYLLKFYDDVKTLAQESTEFSEHSSQILSKIINYFPIVVIIILYLFILPLYNLYLYDFDWSHQAALLVPSVYPWTIDNGFKYALTLIWQLIVIMTGYSALIGFLGSFTCHLICVDFRYKMFEKYLDNAERNVFFSLQKERSNFNSLQITTLELDQRIYERFKSAISDQQSLIEFMKKTIWCYKVMFNVTVFYASYTGICLTLSLLQQNVMMIYKIKLFSSATLSMIHFFIYCYAADFMLGMNQCLSKIVYDAPWYERSIKYRKLAIIFFIGNQGECQVKSFGVYSLNLRFFVSLLRLCYSCVNVLEKTI